MSFRSRMRITVRSVTVPQLPESKHKNDGVPWFYNFKNNRFTKHQLRLLLKYAKIIHKTLLSVTCTLLVVHQHTRIIHKTYYYPPPVHVLQNIHKHTLNRSLNVVLLSTTCVCYKMFTNTLDCSQNIVLLFTTCICYKTFTNTLNCSQIVVILSTTCVCYKTFTNTLGCSQNIVLLFTTCVIYKTFTNTLDCSQNIVLLPPIKQWHSQDLKSGRARQGRSGAGCGRRKSSKTTATSSCIENTYRQPYTFESTLNCLIHLLFQNSYPRTGQSWSFIYMAILRAHVGSILLAISRERLSLSRATQHRTGRAELATANYIAA